MRPWPTGIYSLLFIFLLSCKEKRQEVITPGDPGYTAHTIILTGNNPDFEKADTLCRVSLRLPSRLDTCYRWNDFSDYAGGHYRKYRFSDSRYPPFNESGFYDAFTPDSVYQFSIWHKLLKEVPDSVIMAPFTKDFLLHEVLPGVSKTSLNPDSVVYSRKEWLLVNGRPFLISAYSAPQGYLTRKPTLFVMAATRLHDRELFFAAECCGKDTTGFTGSMYRSVLSIKIAER